MPARKAPSASDSPTRSDSHASPRVISSTLSMKSSVERRLATSVNHQRIRRWPKTSTSRSSSTALSVARPSVNSSSSAGRDSAGSRISSGTTAMSWNSSTPITSRPWRLSSSMRSASSLDRIAVEDIASVPPRAKLAIHPRPNSRPSTVTSAMLASTCTRPRPNTMRFIAISRASENSRPIENIRNTTPNSARWLAPADSCIRFSACGPPIAPTSR